MMLHFLSKVENVVKFQKFCGLSWKDEPLESARYTAASTASTTMGGNKSSDDDEHVNGFVSKNRYANTEECQYCCKENGFVPTEGEERGINQPQQKTEFSYNPIVHRIFKFGSELGNELFYITFLPFIFWNVDDYIARRLIVLWVFNMYAGQGLKDVLCWPRPKSPPVLRLEQIYESEYSMPSTHAIAGAIIPFGLVYFSYGRFQYNVAYGILFFLTWTSLVCLSRVYRGMHTFQDVLAGLSVAAFVTALWLPYLDVTLEMFLSSPNAWIFILLIPILMIYAFPTKCMETRNDTARIISVGCGCMLAAWTDYYIDQVPIPNPFEGAPRPIISTSIVAWVLFGASRFIIGVALLIPIKIILKASINHIGTFLNSSNMKSADRLANESLTIPYLFITYSAIGYTTVYIAPKAFELVGLIL